MVQTAGGYIRVAAIVATALALMSVPASAQGSTGIELDEAYERWLGQLATSYTYEAAVELYLPSVTGTVRATFVNGTATSVSVLAQTPAANVNGSMSVASVVMGVSAMFTQLLAGTATAQPATASSPTFNQTFGYPSVFAATTSTLTEFRIQITSLTVTAIDGTRQQLLSANAAATTAWGSRGWESYHFVTQQSCGLTCPSPDPANAQRTKPVIVNVHSGSVVSALDAETNEQLPSFAQYRPIPAQLSAIAVTILKTSRLSAFSVTYDARLGYPAVLRQSDESAEFDASVTTWITRVEEREIEASGGGTPRWVFAVVILIVIAVIACLVGYFCCRKKADSGPTDRTMAQDERGGAGGATQQPTTRPAERSAAAVDYGDSPVEMRQKQGSAHYEV